MTRCRRIQSSRRTVTALIVAVLGHANAASARLVSKSDGEQIGLTIVGAISNTNPVDNVALVKEIETNRVRAVKAGFELLGRYRVLQVFPKYLIIADGNNEHLVYLSKFAGEFIAGGTTTLTATASHDEYAENGFERRRGEVVMTSAYRDKLIQNDLSQILMQATAIPQIENGRIIGFRLLQIDAGSIYDKAGFVDGDVITKINGQTLTSVGGAVSLLHSLKKEVSIDVEYQRAGTASSMQINVH